MNRNEINDSIKDEQNNGVEAFDRDFDDFDDFADDPIITMVDTETGEEFEFILADDFVFDGKHYCVLVTVDEENPEWVITRVVEEDGQDALLSLDEEEYDTVYAEYDRLCSESIEDEEEASED